MNREQIIHIAKEVGFFDEEIDRCQLMFEAFAKLVAEHEREACAKVCERTKEATTDLFEKAGAHKCATAIRARGQA